MHLFNKMSEQEAFRNKITYTEMIDDTFATSRTLMQRLHNPFLFNSGYLLHL